jgi:GntR family transcriptional regulator, transcriptional repressor for pyruvate dehydrogenase complex
MMPEMTGTYGATSALSALIAERGYRGGDRLPPERDLSEALGVSRPTVREAIGRLVADGVLVARRGSGTYIAPVNLEHIFTVRLALEPLAASLAAEHRSQLELSEMQAALKEMRATLTESDRFSAADERVHELIALASGNPVLRDVLDRLAGLAKLSRSATSGDAAVRSDALSHIDALVSAVARRDGVTARDTMRDHLLLVRRSLTSGKNRVSVDPARSVAMSRRLVPGSAKDGTAGP